MAFNNRTIRELVGTMKINDLQSIHNMTEYGSSIILRYNLAQSEPFKQLCKRDWETLMVAQDKILDQYLVKGA